MQQITKNEIYKHYIALDWSKVNFALASIRDTGTKYKVVEHPADLKLLKQCLKQLPGKKILTIEETTTAQWLYVELKQSAVVGACPVGSKSLHVSISKME